MQLKIWGCRGSVPTPGADTETYGGNTSCVEVLLDDDTALVLDAGTGIRALGLDLVERGTRRIHLFLTHLHLDHLEGLRFFAPLWDDRVRIEIWGPRSPVLSLHDRILRSFSPPLFPLDLRDVPARVTFHDLPAAPWQAGGISLAADLVLHPGPTLGFRLESGESTLAYLPDHEPALAGIGESAARLDLGRLRWPATSISSSTTPSTRRRSTPGRSAGDIRASPTLSPSARRPARVAWCCSTTSPTTPIAPSTSSSSAHASSRRKAASRPDARTRGNDH